MKIIEKKCPNCQANLDFKVGERDVECKSCRRKFAIEYDHELEEDHLQPSDFDLRPYRAVHSIVIVVAVIILLTTIGMFIMMSTNIFRMQRSSTQFIERTLENAN